MHSKIGEVLSMHSQIGEVISLQSKKIGEVLSMHTALGVQLENDFLVKKYCTKQCSVETLVVKQKQQCHK